MLADFALCQNGTCRRRMWCLRYRAVPQQGWQVCNEFKPLAGASQCPNFVNIKPGDKIREVAE